MKPTRSRTAGLTLLEVAICVGLLTLIIVPVFGLLFQSRQTTAESRYYALARSAIQSQIETYKGVANVGETQFGGLAAAIIAANTFMVPGIPRRGDALPQGVVRVCLDETKEYFVAADAPYFGNPPFQQVNYPAFQQDLNGGGSFDLIAPSGTYRVLPVRLEVWWGREPTPKVAVHAVIAPRSDFIRG